MTARMIEEWTVINQIAVDFLADNASVVEEQQELNPPAGSSLNGDGSSAAAVSVESSSTNTNSSNDIHTGNHHGNFAPYIGNNNSDNNYSNTNDVPLPPPPPSPVSVQVPILEEGVTAVVFDAANTNTNSHVNSSQQQQPPVLPPPPPPWQDPRPNIVRPVEPLPPPVLPPPTFLRGTMAPTDTDAYYLTPEDPRGPFGTASARSTSLPKMRRRTAINTPLDAVQWRFLTSEDPRLRPSTKSRGMVITPKEKNSKTGKRGKRPPIFPTRLYDLLENANAAGYAHVISWYEDGTSLRIHTSCDTEIVPILKQRYKSFLRQLQMYGFKRQYKGSLTGIYRHPLFVRSQRAVFHNKSTADFQTAARQAERDGIERAAAAASAGSQASSVTTPKEKNSSGSRMRNNYREYWNETIYYKNNNSTVPSLPGFHGAATKEDFLETHLMNVYVEALLKTGGVRVQASHKNTPNTSNNVHANFATLLKTGGVRVRASHKNTPNISNYVHVNFATTDRREHETIRKLLSRSWQASGLGDYAKAGISVLDTSVIAQLNTFITKNGGDRRRRNTPSPQAAGTRATEDDENKDPDDLDLAVEEGIAAAEGTATNTNGLRTKSIMDDLDEESLAGGSGRNQDEDNDDDLKRQRLGNHDRRLLPHPQRQRQQRVAPEEQQPPPPQQPRGFVGVPLAAAAAAHHHHHEKDDAGDDSSRSTALLNAMQWRLHAARTKKQTTTNGRPRRGSNTVVPSSNKNNKNVNVHYNNNNHYNYNYNSWLNNNHNNSERNTKTTTIAAKRKISDSSSSTLDGTTTTNGSSTPPSSTADKKKARTNSQKHYSTSIRSGNWGNFTAEEDRALLKTIEEQDGNWDQIVLKMGGRRSIYSLRSRLFRLNQKKKKTTTDAETTLGTKPVGEDDDDTTEDAPENYTEDNGNSEDAEQEGIDSTNYDDRTERKRKYESPVNDDKWMLHHTRLREYCQNRTTFPTLKMLNHAYPDCKLGTWVNSQRCAYRNKRNYEISDERVALLNQVRGWKWLEYKGKDLNQK